MNNSNTVTKLRPQNRPRDDRSYSWGREWAKSYGTREQLERLKRLIDIRDDEFGKLLAEESAETRIARIAFDDEQVDQEQCAKFWSPINEIVELSNGRPLIKSGEDLWAFFAGANSFFETWYVLQIDVDADLGKPNCEKYER